MIIIWYGTIMICYDMIWYDMIWYDMIWYDGGTYIVVVLAVTGLTNEAELVDFLMFSDTSVQNEHLYLAGVVFDNPESYQSHIPFNISYTIR